MGSVKAGNMLIAMAQEFMDSSMSFQKKTKYLGSLVSYANKQDNEQELLGMVEQICDQLIQVSDGEEPRFIQQVYNQKNRLYYGIFIETEEIEWLYKAIQALRMALQIAPATHIYYNAALCYRSLALKTEEIKRQEAYRQAIDCIEQCLKMDKEPDGDHLELACKIYYEVDDPRYDEIMVLFEQVSSYAALVLKNNLK